MREILINEICKNLKLGISKYEEFIDFLYNSNDTYNLDLYPFYIDNVDKYNQVEIYYQKHLDKYISKRIFEDNEIKFHDFVKTLWIYNNVFVKVNIDYNHLRMSKYFKRNKKIMKNSMKYVRLNQSNNLFQISSLDDLTSVLFLATRDVSQILLYFDKFNLTILLYGCSGIVYFYDNNIYEKLFLIANNCRLYLINNKNI